MNHLCFRQTGAKVKFYFQTIRHIAEKEIEFARIYSIPDKQLGTKAWPHHLASLTQSSIGWLDLFHEFN